jgi:hypothetical protein
VKGLLLERVSDATLPEVTDDVVDELIELVLHRGGSVVVVADDDLVDQQRVAAILRY